MGNPAPAADPVIFAGKAAANLPKRRRERKPSLFRTNQRSTDPDPLHERFTAQLDFDYRTRRPTGIRFSEPAAHQRAACNALNRERARGLLEAARHAPPGESIPVDVWNAGFARKCAEWGIPLIPSPTIIDALLGSVTHASKQSLAWLRDAVEDAHLRRKGLPVMIRGGLVAAPDEEL